MNHAERNAAIIKAIEDYTREHTATKAIAEVQANVKACTPTVRNAETILADWKADTPAAEARKLSIYNMQEAKDAQL